MARINSSTDTPGWRLVHNDTDVITFDYFDKGITQSIFTILEFETKEAGEAKIQELNLNYEEPAIE